MIGVPKTGLGDNVANIAFILSMICAERQIMVGIQMGSKTVPQIARNLAFASCIATHYTVSAKKWVMP
jgi:hypothetical protein